MSVGKVSWKGRSGLAALVLAGWLGVSGCASPVDVSVPRLAPGQIQSLEQRLLIHQWGGWHRVTMDAEVAFVQEQAVDLEQEGLGDEALQEINLGLDRWPESPTLLECRAAIYGSMGYWRAAESDFEAATRLRPSLASTWEALARCRQELGLWNAERSARSEAQRLSLLP